MTRKHTHCKRGHRFTPENTYTYPGSGRRQCLACKRGARNKVTIDGKIYDRCPSGHAMLPDNTLSTDIHQPWTKRCAKCAARYRKQAAERKARDPEERRRAAEERKRERRVPELLEAMVDDECLPAYLKPKARRMW